MTQEYIIFGTGSVGRKLLEYFNRYFPHIKIAYFLDNNINKNVNGYTVKHPSNLVLNRNQKILIASSYAEEIIVQLEKMNYQQNLHFYDARSLPGLLARYEKFLLNKNKLDENKIKYNFIDINRLKTKKTSDRLFILGTGGTINDITDEQWGHIKKYDSWGMNYWSLHSFVPTYYTFEFFYKTENLDNLIKLNRLLNIDYDFIKELGNMEDNSISILKSENKIIPFLQNHYLDFYSKKDFEQRFDLLKELNLIEDDNCFYSFVSTAVTIFSIAIRLGYKEIIFCGVELKNNGYFYDDYDDVNEYFIPRSDKKQLTHETFCDQSENLGADQMIFLLYEKFNESKELKLYTATTKSALYPKLPLYNWE
ncbi:hypothetical protein ABFY48_02015 [Lysinibacillus pakistanensis]|uniref:hypothetical protein n=1 Tax=Lysinibacillus pakistanensis TaxID=759811 RepID=UPI003D2D4ADE